MPHSPTELERIGEESSDKGETFELEDTAVDTPEASLTHVPLKAALDMGGSGSRSDISKDRKLGTLFASKHPLCQTYDHRSRPPKIPLPAIPSGTHKGSGARTACRWKVPSPSCSLLCDEEEAIFPVRKWSKPLAEMGDALNWKLSVLNRFNAIQY